MKKFLAAVLTAAMVIGTMCVSAFAADGDYFISGSEDGDNGGNWSVGTPFSAAWVNSEDAAAASELFADNGDGTYSVTISGFDTATQYAVKAVSADGATWIGNEEDGGNLLFVSETGTVKFTTDGAAIWCEDVTADEETADEDPESGSTALPVVLAAVASLAVVATVSTKKFAER